MDCETLSTSRGDFTFHHYQGEGAGCLLCLPGLMEPKAGLFYFWRQLAQAAQKQGYSALLVDLAGQGDSCLPLSFDLWHQQCRSIQVRFRGESLTMIARGVSSLLLPAQGHHIAINPCLRHPTASQLQAFRWLPSPFNPGYLAPAKPGSLSAAEVDCLHALGAEAACVGGMELPKDFVQTIISKLAVSLCPTIHSIFPEREHPLFDKEHERDTLIRRILDQLKGSGSC